MLENIGKNNDANFRLKLDKISDDNYNKALECLRKHLNVIEYVIELAISGYQLERVSVIKQFLQIRRINRLYVYKYVLGQYYFEHGCWQYMWHTSEYKPLCVRQTKNIFHNEQSFIT